MTVAGRIGDGVVICLLSGDLFSEAAWFFMCSAAAEKVPSELLS